MSDEARSAVASYLSVHKGQEKGVTRLTTSAGLQDHPFLDSAYQCVEELWTEVGCLQQCHGQLTMDLHKPVYKVWYGWVMHHRTFRVAALHCCTA